MQCYDINILFAFSLVHQKVERKGLYIIYLLKFHSFKGFDIVIMMITTMIMDKIY